jgi:hypothetical protein
MLGRRDYALSAGRRSGTDFRAAAAPALCATAPQQCVSLSCLANSPQDK